MIALDKSAIKVEKVVNNLQGWDVTCVDCYTQDSTKCSNDKAGTVHTNPTLSSHCIHHLRD